MSVSATRRQRYTGHASHCASSSATPVSQRKISAVNNVNVSSLSTLSLLPITPQLPTPRPTSQSLRRLQWDDTDHISVLTQIHGSVWPKVWPYCVANTLWFSFVYLMKHAYDIDLKTSTVTGHRYMGMVMSFLVVTRVRLQYVRYMADAAAWHDLCGAVRDMAVKCCYNSNNTLLMTPEWRFKVLLATIRMLSKALQVLELRSHIWEMKQPHIPESLLLSSIIFNGMERTASSASLLFDEEGYRDGSDDGQSSSSPTVLLTQASRAVTHEAMCVRGAIVSYRKDNLSDTANMDALMFLDIVGAFLKKYSVLGMHLVTPVPFPFVQMAKTLLFVWVFTIPLALTVDKANVFVVYACIVFLITYGFVGLEIVAMELSDCFGEDPCDLDQHTMAEQYCEDCYLAVYKTDGREWALRLRNAAGPSLKSHRTRRMGTLSTTTRRSTSVTESATTDHSNNGLVSDETLRMLQSLSCDDDNSEGGDSEIV